MKKVTWEVAINDDDGIASMEQISGFGNLNIETHLMLIGILDNLKIDHQNKLDAIFNRTKLRCNSLNSEYQNEFED